MDILKKVKKEVGKPGDQTSISVYTDGSLVRKGKQVFCGYGIYFPGAEYKPISRKFTHEPITNNRAELYAILKSIILCNKIDVQRKLDGKQRVKRITIYSDSEYSVKTYNEWLPKWLKSGKPYLNSDIINETWDHISNAPFSIFIEHIRAHTGKSDPHHVSNDIVDQLAKKGAYK
jgi:ribonuclease HI